MAIRHKRTTTTGYTWQSGDTVEGQIGLNLTDGTLHFKKANGDYVSISQGSGGGITDIVQDTTPQLGGDLDVNGNKIVSTANANVEIAPNGTGDVYLTADTVRVGDLDSTVNIISNGAGDLNLTVGSANAGQIILRQGNDGNIEFVPHGTGAIYSSSNTLRLGISNQNATLTTNGTGDLILNTNSGTNSGSITIEDGVNGNILLTPNGTGKVVITEIIAPTGLGGDVSLSPDGTGNVNLNADTVRIGDNNDNVTLTTHGTGDLILNTNSGTNSGSITIEDGVNGNITLAPNGTGSTVVNSYSIKVGDASLSGNITTVGAGNLVLNTNGGTNSGSITLNHSANSNIDIDPNGTGNVNLIADVIKLGNTNTDTTMTTNGTGDLILNTNTGTNSGSIRIEDGANGNIIIAPNGTGDVYVDADTLRVGDSGAAATVTTNGAGQLTLSTDGTAAGKPSIVIPSSTSGNLTISASSTGAIVLSGVTIAATSSTTNNIAAITGRSVQTASNTLQRFSLIAQKHRTDITLASMTDEPAVIGFQVRDSASANRMFATQRATYTGTGANPIMYFNVSTDNYTTTVNTLNFNDTRAVWGNLNTNYTLTTNGTGDLTLSTNEGTNSGTIKINDGTNGNIEITPNGTGKISLDGLLWPNADGTNGQMLQTNGSGTLAWATPSSVTNDILIYIDGGSGFWDSSLALPAASNTDSTSVFAVAADGGVSGVSATTGYFTLPAGTYVMTLNPWITASSATYADIRLYNKTSSAGIQNITTKDITLAGATARLYVPNAGIKFVLSASSQLTFRSLTTRAGEWYINPYGGGSFTINLRKVA